jgi:integrase
MVQRIKRLSPRSVGTVKEPGRHADGGGLYLIVDESGTKRWAFFFRWQGRRREMGLGGLISVSLAEARGLAEDSRKLLARGLDPIVELRRRRSPKAVPTFGKFAEALIADMAPGWRHPSSRRQWTMTLTVHAKSISEKPIDAITTEDVLEVLRPLWPARCDTASKLRRRIEKVLDAAKAKGLRSGENPARGRGHLDHLLPKPLRVERRHFAAMPFSSLPAFISELRKNPSLAAFALELAILTAGRIGEVTGARWDEINRDARVWTIPASRMKGVREHQVPLSGRAVDILEEAAKLRSGDFVFPGQQTGRPLSPSGIRKFLRRQVTGPTVHGFRSAFRDWAGDKTSFPREVAEAALAHRVGDQTEGSYRRGDALEKRRELMEAWARFCSPSPAQVIQLRR